METYRSSHRHDAKNWLLRKLMQLKIRKKDQSLFSYLPWCFCCFKCLLDEKDGLLYTWADAPGWPLGNCDSPSSVREKTTVVAEEKGRAIEQNLPKTLPFVLTSLKTHRDRKGERTWKIHRRDSTYGHNGMVNRHECHEKKPSYPPHPPEVYGLLYFHFSSPFLCVLGYAQQRRKATLHTLLKSLSFPFSLKFFLVLIPSQPVEFFYNLYPNGNQKGFLDIGHGSIADWKIGESFIFVSFHLRGI